MGEEADKRGWLVLPAAVVLLVLFAYPVSWLLLRSITEPELGLQNFRKLIEAPVYLKALWNTVVISGSVTLICLLLGYPMAYTIANAGERMRRLLIFAVLVPFWASILVRTFAWMVLLQKRGLINKVLLDLNIIAEPLTLIYNRTGVLIGMVHILLPFMILPLYAVLARIDPSYMRAAAGLGATPFWSFVRVYLPLSLPGIVSGTVLVFVLGLGYYITPALLGSPGELMIAQLIEMQVADFGNWGLAAALAVVLFAGTAVTFAFIRRSLTEART
jgi:putative spermidine/putrescine transport system permease protein